jgi:membrane protein YqaA with SNARE-associated domain
MPSLAVLAITLMDWLHRLGGLGLVLLGVGSQLVPLPGSMDALTLVLAGSKQEWWPYYGLMATLGSVLGGYTAYRLAEKGGKETLERKIGRLRAQRIYRRVEQRGFATVIVGSILPPPFPFIPFPMAAGALHYPPRKFLTALGLGRGVRFFAVAYIGQRYGRSITGFLAQYKEPVLYALAALAGAGGIALVVYLWWRRRR